MTETACPGCGVDLPTLDGPTHKYMLSTPACWAAFGEILAREYSDPSYFAAHRLTVDAYAVQHPGQANAQSIQSVAVHLIGLHLALEQGLGAQQVLAATRQHANEDTFQWLVPPARRGALTVADVLPATDAAGHVTRVRAWAESAWQAWSGYHEQVRAWAK